MSDYKVPFISGAVPSANDVLHWNGNDWVCHDITASINTMVDSAISDVVAQAVSETASLATAITSVETTLSDATSDARSLASAAGGGGVTESHMDSAIASIETVLSDATSEVQSSVDSVVGHDGDGYILRDVNGTPTKVYTKYFTGTTDNDDTTNIAHGITGINNILACKAVVYNSNTNKFEAQIRGALGVDIYTVAFDGTNVILGSVTANFRSQLYRIRMDYIL